MYLYKLSRFGNGLPNGISLIIRLLFCLLKWLDPTNLSIAVLAVVVGLFHGLDGQRQPTERPKDQDSCANTNPCGSGSLGSCSSADLFFGTARAIRQHDRLSTIQMNVIWAGNLGSIVWRLWSSDWGGGGVIVVVSVGWCRLNDRVGVGGILFGSVGMSLCVGHIGYCVCGNCF